MYVFRSMCDIVCCFRFFKYSLCYLLSYMYMNTLLLSVLNSYSFSVFLELLVRVYRFVEYTVDKVIKAHCYNVITSQ